MVDSIAESMDAERTEDALPFYGQWHQQKSFREKTEMREASRASVDAKRALVAIRAELTEISPKDIQKRDTIREKIYLLREQVQEQKFAIGGVLNHLYDFMYQHPDANFRTIKKHMETLPQMGAIHEKQQEMRICLLTLWGIHGVGKETI